MFDLATLNFGNLTSEVGMLRVKKSVEQLSMVALLDVDGTRCQARLSDLLVLDATSMEGSPVARRDEESSMQVVLQCISEEQLQAENRTAHRQPPVTANDEA
jgi:hypothetical protein